MPANDSMRWLAAASRQTNLEIVALNRLALETLERQVRLCLRGLSRHVTRVLLCMTACHRMLAAKCQQVSKPDEGAPAPEAAAAATSPLHTRAPWSSSAPAALTKGGPAARGGRCSAALASHTNFPPVHSLPIVFGMVASLASRGRADEGTGGWSGGLLPQHGQDLVGLRWKLSRLLEAVSLTASCKAPQASTASREAKAASSGQAASQHAHAQGSKRADTQASAERATKGAGGSKQGREREARGGSMVKTSRGRPSNAAGLSSIVFSSMAFSKRPARIATSVTDALVRASRLFLHSSPEALVLWQARF